MSSSEFSKDVTIDFSRDNQKGVRQWLLQLGRKADEVPDLTMKVIVDFDLEEFDDDDIRDEYDRRFRQRDDAPERIFRLMAEGDTPAAMDEMAREFGLAPPSHACALARRCAGPKV